MALAFLADEYFPLRVVREVLRQNPSLDIVRIYRAGLSGAEDPEILQWAAGQRRILLTNDRGTVPGFAYERVTAGLPMPGVVIIRRGTPTRLAAEAILIFSECSREDEWEGQVIYLPL